jgi:hypothetical protein
MADWEADEKCRPRLYTGKGEEEEGGEEEEDYLLLKLTWFLIGLYFTVNQLMEELNKKEAKLKEVNNGGKVDK